MKRPTPGWLSNAVFYEVYPQSFLDTNGDGIGDLPGVIRKLDYIRSLGCNAIWLNPCFVSPMGDAGYDVADFYRVDPRYGTNADLRRLFREAHRRGLKVCLDLVAGHTSLEHPWFQASARAKRNRYSDWYIWTDSVWERPALPTQVPPMNVVNGYGERDGNYVANFFHFQPALNYGFAKPNPSQSWQLPVTHPACQAVRREMKKIMRYWLDLGADGFRVDMAFSLVKGDRDLKVTMALWHEVRTMFDRHYPEAVLISEWSDPEKAIPAGFHMDFLLSFGHPGYNTLFRAEKTRNVFPQARRLKGSYFDRRGVGNIRLFLDYFLRQRKATQGLGYISIPSGNHDMSRLAQGRTPAELKVAFAFLLTLPGVPYLYNGDELGMNYQKGLVSKEGGYGRTGSRTPMPWGGGQNAGFSTSAPNRLYLPVSRHSGRPTVAVQERDPQSLLNHWRRLAGLRQTIVALQAEGEFIPVYARVNRYPFVYLRQAAGTTILVALNPSARPAAVWLDQATTKEPVALLGGGAKLRATGRRLRLEMSGVSFGLFRIFP